LVTKTKRNIRKFEEQLTRAAKKQTKNKKSNS
jgi:hypothetical protein